MNAATLGVVLEERFCRLPDGTLFSPSGFGDGFWARYLVAFESVVIIARLRVVDCVEPNWVPITDQRVRIFGLPEYVGIGGFLRRFTGVFGSFKCACALVDALCVRAPGALSLLALSFVGTAGGRTLPVVVELVGDPVDVFGSGVGGRLSWALRFIFRRATEALCVRADAVSYVTKSALQRRYPARAGVRTINCSSLELPDVLYAAESRQYSDLNFEDRRPVIFTAASLEVPYKGVAVLIAAVAALKDYGVVVGARIAGAGRLRGELERIALSLGVAERIAFVGRLSRVDVLDEMRKADLYVQPSLTEGLPRAVIEACAMAAPVIATRVGGVPELLADEDMVPPSNPELLAQSIRAVLSEPSRMEAMSARNLRTAADYSSAVLTTRRNQFFIEFRALMDRRG